MLEVLIKTKGILGMNARNNGFIRPGSSKRKFAIVDSKLRTKRLLKRFELPHSDLFGVVRNRKELYGFDWKSLPNSFVVKPDKGFGGEGIKVTFGKNKKNNWIMSLGRELTIPNLIMHASDILDGNYSLANVPDIVFFEERLKIHPVFKLYSYKGVPDIRIIVYNNVPVMAMLRLPTKSSGGKANLHQGGIGVGIDIGTGMTTFAILNNKIITELPETRFKLRGIKIPNWDELLELSIEAQMASELDFLGVDVAVDREKGPVILELNARPGLSVQMANMRALKERLLRVQGLKVPTVKKGISIAKEVFSGDMSQTDPVSGKKVVGVIEEVTVFGKAGKKKTVKAKIDSGAGISSIDEGLARELGFEDALKFYDKFDIPTVLTREEVEELSKKEIWKEMVKHPDIVKVVKTFSSHGVSYRIEVPVGIGLLGEKVNSMASVICREDMIYPVIIGRRDLKKFLIDPNKLK